MAEVKFYGASDDCVEVEGCEGADEFAAFYGPGKLMWGGDLVTADAALRVYAVFDGCWHFSVGQADEAFPLPSWPVRFEQHRSLPYSVLLTVEAPDGVRLANVWPKAASDG